MKEKFRDWYLAVNIAPQDGQIQKRISAIESFCKNINKSRALNLVKLYYGFDTEASFKTEFINCIVAGDEAFPAKNEEELKVLAGAALVHLAETSRAVDSVVELFSMAVNEFRSPSVTSEIYDIILENYYNDSLSLRSFNESSEKLEPLQIKELAAHIKENALDTVGLEILIKVLTGLQKWQKGLTSRLEHNEEQMSIYREDSQILWWLMGEHCHTLDASLKGLDKIRTCLVLGKEASGFISNYPGPNAIKATLNKMIGCCKGKSEHFTIDQVVVELPEEWKGNLISTVSGFPFIDLLPLTSAIVRSKNTASTNEWYPRFKREILSDTHDPKRTPQEFAWQMYLESLALKCYFEMNS